MAAAAVPVATGRIEIGMVGRPLPAFVLWAAFEGALVYVLNSGILRRWLDIDAGLGASDGVGLCGALLLFSVLDDDAEIRLTFES